jgi:hypothetical protein
MPTKTTVKTSARSLKEETAVNKALIRELERLLASETRKNNRKAA